MKSRCLTSLFIPKRGLLVVILALFGAYPASFLSGGHDQPSASDNQENLSVVNSENNYTVIRTNYRSQDRVVVKLQGEFDDTQVVTELNTIRFLSIPASVDEEGIVHEERLQIWRQISDPQNITRNITYADQFGKRNLNITQDHFLVVPADGVVAKHVKSERIAGQHYKAYRTSGAGFGQEVVLVDGISQDSITVGAPQYFLVPVEKQHAGRTWPIENASHCFMVYNIAPRYDLKGRVASMSDQFYDVNLNLQHKHFLAVPAELLAWEVVPQ